MPNIQVLPFAVANLIAAGEVVDRPSSVIKELLENAIDAGGTDITVEIQNGGVRFMRVTDNGCGMAPEDLPTAIQRHATSKIRTAADLDGIATLGFRGEALAAISSVAKVRILSREKDAEIGAMLECQGGEIVAHTEAGCPAGTTIVVEDLFYNVPARRKFLKKDATEAIACGTVVEKIALSHPEIALKYISDGEVKFRTVGNGDLSATMYALFGREIAKRSLWTDRTENGIRVWGYVSEPDLFRPNRNLENFFINGRYVKSRTAGAAVEQAYSSKIPHDTFPVCVLHLEIAPGAVDVNVHPTKLEVKFTNEKTVFDAIYYAALTALESAATRPELTVTPSEQLAIGEKTPAQEKKNTPNIPFSGTPRQKKDFWATGAEARRLINAFVPQDGTHRKSTQISMDENLLDKEESKAAPIQNPETPSRSKGTDWHSWKAELHAIPPSMSEDAPPPPEEPPLPPETPLPDTEDIPPFAPEDVPQHEDGIPVGGIPLDVLMMDAPPPAPELPLEEPAIPEPIVSPAAVQENMVPVPETVPDEKSTFSKEKSPEPMEKPTFSEEKPTFSEEKLEESPVPEESEPEPLPPYDAPPYQILGEAFNTYIIVQLEDRLLMIDKHAAHERILFDELCRRMRERNHGGQVLLSPMEVTLLQSEAVMLTDYEDSLRSLGFAWEAEPASLSTVKVSLTQLPDMLTLQEGTALFGDLITHLAEATATVESASAAYFETKLWQASCKAAIKGGRMYDMVHLQWLCDRLLVKPEKEGASVIRTCPHGRPVAFEIKKSSIERQFARLM